MFLHNLLTFNGYGSVLKKFILLKVSQLKNVLLKNWFLF